MSSLLFVSDLKYSCGYGAHKVLGGCLGWGYSLYVTFPKLYRVFLTWRSCHWIHLEDENLCFLSIYFIVWITEGLRMFPLLFLSSLPPWRGDCDPWILHMFLLWNLILNILFGIITLYVCFLIILTLSKYHFLGLTHPSSTRYHNYAATRVGNIGWLVFFLFA